MDICSRCKRHIQRDSGRPKWVVHILNMLTHSECIFYRCIFVSDTHFVSRACNAAHIAVTHCSGYFCIQRCSSKPLDDCGRHGCLRTSPIPHKGGSHCRWRTRGHHFTCPYSSSCCLCYPSPQKDAYTSFSRVHACRSRGVRVHDVARPIFTAISPQRMERSCVGEGTHCLNHGT